MFKNPFKWRKPFVANKEEFIALSDTEKGLIERHRAELLGIHQSQLQVQDEISRVFAPSKSTNESAIEYVTDFFGPWQAGNNIMPPVNDMPDNGQNPMLVTELTINAGTAQEKVVGRVVGVKPKDVLKELETFAGAEIIENIDAKIAVFKMRKELVVGGNYAKNELIGMEFRLENRKKWADFKDFYSQFDNTTSGKIQDLVNKYKLVLKGSDLFIASFPDEAISIMKEYKEQTIKLCGKQPYFYVIAEASSFKEEYRKKDPILLAQSPFGAYWQILGAWDKEMILLEEL